MKAPVAKNERDSARRSSWILACRAATEGGKPVVKPGSVVDNHSSSPCLAARLKQRTRGRVEPTHSPPIWPCSGWGLPCHAALAPHAVGSYPTVSPLPRTLAGRSAVYSLLHWPSAHAAQELPGTLLYGARTFLGAIKSRRGCLDRLRRRHCLTAGRQASPHDKVLVFKCRTPPRWPVN